MSTQQYDANLFPVPDGRYLDMCGGSLTLPILEAIITSLATNGEVHVTNCTATPTLMEICVCLQSLVNKQPDTDYVVCLSCGANYTTRYADGKHQCPTCGHIQWTEQAHERSAPEGDKGYLGRADGDEHSTISKS